MKILIQSYETNDEELTFSTIAALGNFAADKGY